MTGRYSLFHLIPYLVRYRGAMAVGFTMVLLTIISSAFSPWVLKYVVDGLQASFSARRLPEYAGMILGIAMVEGFFRFWMRKVLIGASRDIEFDLRNDFLSHLQRMPLSFFQTRNTGDIMSRATNDLNAVRSVLGPGIMYSMTTIVTVVLTTFILLRLNWQLTLVAYIPLALLSVLVKNVGQKVHDRFEKVQEQFSHISTKAQENLSGIRVVKSFAREESEIREFEALNRDYVNRSLSLIRLWGIFYPLMTCLIGLSLVALLWLGGRLVMTGRLSLGEFVAFTGYLSMLTWPTIAVGWVINIFQRGAASMSRMLEIMNLEPEIRDRVETEFPAPMAGGIEIRNLSFTYSGSERPVLRGVSVQVSPGSILAIVGQTGSGKSTLINLLPRLYDPPPGTVFIDGTDIRSWPLSELRARIGYVPQETFLFSDTIRENILFGTRPDVPEAALTWAARVSQVETDIHQFPQGFETFVGERGIMLSGGQKQRVAISRAVARRPAILILDDSLSSVDTDTEERILAELRDVMRDRTTILVSHRISTVKGAHQIVVLQDGEIIERGTHESLMELKGAYATLHQKQLLEEELATA